MTQNSEAAWTLDRVLALMGEQERTGVLSVTSGATGSGAQTRIHMRKGVVMWAERTGGGSWALGDYLTATGLIRANDLTAAAAEAERTGVRLEELLTTRRGMSPDIVRRLLNLEVAELIFPLFRESGVTIQFLEERPISPELVTPLPVRFILKEATRRNTEWPDLRQRVGHPTAIYQRDDADMAEVFGYDAPAPDDDEGDDAPREALSADARVAYFHMDGQRTTEEVARAAGLGLFETYRAIDDLLEQYLVRVSAATSTPKPRKAGRSLMPRIVSIVTYLALALGIWLGVDQLLRHPELLEDAMGASAPELDHAIEGALLNEFHTALALFQVETGALPESLETLVNANLLAPHAASQGPMLRYERVGTGYTLERTPPATATSPL